MKFGIMHPLDSAGNSVSDYRNCIEQCVLAEKVGFGSFFCAEHHGTDTGRIPTPEIMCGALARLTERIRLGTGIIPLPLHHPLRIAEAASVVDIMSNGRFILGLGLGYKKEEFDAFGIPLSERRGRFEEGVRIIRKLFTEEQVTFDGRFFKLTRFPLMPKPVQKGGPPIWIGALARPAVLRAARLGDAWIPSPVMPLEVLKERILEYRQCLKQQGIDYESIERPLRREAFIAQDTETAWNLVKQGLLIKYKPYVDWDQPGGLVDDSGAPLKPRNATELMETLSKRFIIGGTEDFLESIARYHNALGTNHFLLQLQFVDVSHRDVMEAIKLIGEKIIPYFADEEDDG